MKPKFMIATLCTSVLLGVSLSACSPVNDAATKSIDETKSAPEREPTGKETDKDTTAELLTIDSGVEGHLWIGPACPVIEVGTECPDLPYEAEFTITDAEGELVANGKSGEDGYFLIPLGPGSYIFVPNAAKPTVSARTNPVPFDVIAGSVTELDVSYDSGLR